MTLLEVLKHSQHWTLYSLLNKRNHLRISCDSVLVGVLLLYMKSWEMHGLVALVIEALHAVDHAYLVNYAAIL